MAQAMCEKPQPALEAVVNQETADRTVTTAILNATSTKANGTAKANDDVSSNAGAKEIPSSPTNEKKNRIQVSNTKKPLFFYLNLAKRYIKQYNEVELSALGMAIPTVVTISEIMKANGVAVEKKVLTSTVDSKDENKGRLVQKAKIEIVLERNRATKDSEDPQSDDESKEKEE